MFFCTLFIGVAMIMDVKREKVYNFWILTGVLVSVIFQFSMPGDESWNVLFWKILKGIGVPGVLFFPLFLCRMIGTGDIKVFMVLGSMMGTQEILWCIGLSFLIGAVISLPILLFRCDYQERFIYFFTYLKKVLMTKTFPPYLAQGKHPENIHFTIPIFFSTLILAIGGKIV